MGLQYFLLNLLMQGVDMAWFSLVRPLHHLQQEPSGGSHLSGNCPSLLQQSQFFKLYLWTLDLDSGLLLDPDLNSCQDFWRKKNLENVYF